MKIMKHAEKKASGAGVLHPLMFAEYPQGCCSITGEKQSLLKPLFCWFTTLAITTSSASTAPPSLGLEKHVRLPQCVILGKASQQGSEFWFDIKRGELIFHWGIADLQCGVSFGCIAKWFSYTSMNIVISLFRSFSCRCYYRILSSLCYMVGPCWSSVSSMVMYVCEEGSLCQIVWSWTSHHRPI